MKFLCFTLDASTFRQLTVVNGGYRSIDVCSRNENRASDFMSRGVIKKITER